MEQVKRISESELQEKLRSAKKVMDKVEGTFQPNTIQPKQINEDVFTQQNAEIDGDFIEEQRLNALYERVEKSTLPSVIKQKFINENKEKVKQQQQVQKQQVSKPEGTSTNISLMIENAVRKVLTEMFDKKLEQILLAKDSQTINENLVIKVGENLFSGNITKVHKK